MLTTKSIFSDAASLVLRSMLADPGREWVARDFVEELGIGRGWAADVLSVLRKKGYLKGESRGRLAGSILRNNEELIQEWVDHYKFEFNKSKLYYSPRPNLQIEINEYLEKSAGANRYAFTLHSGANLITKFVRDPNIYLYLDPNRFEELSLGLRGALDLKELKSGGNVQLILPYYKRSVFMGLRKIKKFPVVSNLQLYLDLFHFPQRGREQADMLVRILKENGERIG